MRLMNLMLKEVASIQMTDIFAMSPRNQPKHETDKTGSVGVIHQEQFKIVATGRRSVIQHSAPVPPLHQQVNIARPDFFFAFGEVDGSSHMCADLLDNSKTRRTGLLQDHRNIEQQM